jgi:AcrR family transcriptional regulator
MAERRERILAAARDVIARRGVEALTMRELARASRVTVPTIYNLIGSREAVVLAAIEAQIARFLAALEATSGSDPPARMLAVVGDSARELTRQPAYYRSLLLFLFESARSSPARAAVDRALRAPFADALEAIERAGDTLPGLDAATLAERLAMRVQLVSLEWASGGLPDEALLPVSRYEVALALAGATRGPTRAAFEAVVRAEQARTRRPRAASATQSQGHRT